MKSTTCRGANGQFLEEYHSRTAAELAIETQNGDVRASRESPVQKAEGKKFIPIQCSRCGYWHITISSVSRQCFQCSDSALFQKDIYSTREDAQRTADWLKREKKVEVFPYRCPHGSGWHLSKRRGK